MSVKLGIPQMIVPEIDDDGDIVWKKGQENLPICLLLGDDGLYLRTKTGIFESVVKVLPEKFAFPDIKGSNLIKKESGFRFQLPKLAESHVRKAHAFLKASWIENESETAILYFFNPKTKEYREFVPEQIVSAGSIKYEISAEEHAGMRKDGFILVGTIHSHPGQAAYQSGTDEHDELEIDGWHITLGDVTKRIPTYDGRWCIAKKTHKCPITDIVEFDEVIEDDFPKEWLDRVSKFTVHTGRRVPNWIQDSEEDYTTGWFPENGGYHGGYSKHAENCPCSTCKKPVIVKGATTGFKSTKVSQMAMFTEDKRAKELRCTIEYM